MLREQSRTRGFTLIELLVVVLIIGILASIALPQYEKAVEKSRSTQAIALLKTLYASAESYFMATGSWTVSFEEIAVDIPFQSVSKWYTSPNATEALGNKDWSFQFVTDSGNLIILAGHRQGEYAKAGFAILHSYINQSVPIGQVICIEKNAGASETIPGYMCEKLFQGTLSYTSPGFRYYKMP